MSEPINHEQEQDLVASYNAEVRERQLRRIFENITPKEIQVEMRRYIIDNPDKHQLLRQVAMELAPLLLD